MKSPNSSLQNRIGKNRKTPASAFFSFTLLLIFALFASNTFFPTGEAQETTASDDFAAAPEVAPAAPTLISSRCPSYAAPAVPAPLNTFYINADAGNDSNNGRTPATAWKTLSKANSGAKPGDLFLMRGVFYNQNIAPFDSNGKPISGTAENKITFRREPGQIAVLDVQPGTTWDGAVFLIGNSHIVIDGLEIRNRTYAVQIANYDRTPGGGSHNWLRNIYLHDTDDRPNTGGVTFRFYANFNRLEDSVLDKIGSDQHNTNDAVNLLNDADNNVIVRNYIGTAGHSAYGEDLQGESTGYHDNNILAHNIIANGWANNVILGARSRNSLIECNVIKNAAQTTGYNYARAGVYLNGKGTTLRYNYIYNNKAQGVSLLAYGTDEDPEDNRIYQNTIVGNGDAALFMYARNERYLRNNIIENNIFWNNRGRDGGNGKRYDINIDLYNSAAPWQPGFTDGNIIRNNNVSNLGFLAVGRHQSFGGSYYYDQPTVIAGTWTNNTQSDPLFKDSASHDYTLRSDSPMIDAGRVLPDVAYNGGAPDMGAFETGTGAPAPATTPPPVPAPTSTPAPTPTATPTATPTPTPNATPGNQAPYGGTAPSVPTIIEAENFDSGGEGVAYHDNDAANQGATYRPNESVDVRRNSAASNQYTVFNGSAGEWLEYTFNVPTTGLYDVGVFYASEFTGGEFHLEIDNANVTGRLKAASTGSWWTYNPTGKSGIRLSAGAHVLRLVLDANAAGSQVVADFDKIYIRKKRSVADFDGDGKADLSVFRPATGTWNLNRSTAGFTAFNFGAATDRLVPGDYDGDGRTDAAVFRDGNWYLLRSSNNQFQAVQFGAPGDVPAPGDFDGDGLTDLAVFRPSNGVWYLLQSAAGYTAVQFGAAEDKPAAADFDGDSKTDIAVFRPGNGTWYLLRSKDGFTATQFGQNGDQPVAADYDGDGKTDVAVFRSSNGTWYLLRSSAGYTGSQFGLGTDAPVPADYDGDGRADVAVFRNGNWYFVASGTNEFHAVPFGAAGDKPVPASIVP